VAQSRGTRLFTVLEKALEDSVRMRPVSSR
jgi:hypothetical protein